MPVGWRGCSPRNLGGFGHSCCPPALGGTPTRARPCQQGQGPPAHPGVSLALQRLGWPCLAAAWAGAARGGKSSSKARPNGSVGHGDKRAAPRSGLAALRRCRSAANPIFSAEREPGDGLGSLPPPHTPQRGLGGAGFGGPPLPKAARMGGGCTALPTPARTGSGPHPALAGTIGAFPEALLQTLLILGTGARRRWPSPARPRFCC